MTTEAPSTRSIGSAVVSFGLIAIPIKLYTTEQTVDEISFNMLHDADHARVKQQYVCTQCNEVVDKDHATKGYEHAKGQWVIFTADELAALDAVATNTVELDGFVPADAIDPLYVEKTYYAGPDKGHDKVYTLLARVLDRRGVVGVGRWSTRGKEHIVAIRPYRDGIAIHQLRYEREVKPWAAVPARAEVRLSPAEIALGEQLVERMEQSDLELGRYVDRVHERRKALIQTKVDGGAITVVANGTEITPPAALDLLTSLKASLDSQPKHRATPIKKSKKPAKRRKAA